MMSQLAGFELLSVARRAPVFAWFPVAMITMLAACGGGGSSAGGMDVTPTPVPSVTPTTQPTPTPGPVSCSGDDCRRAVLADIGEQIILPGLRDFAAQAEALATAAEVHAAQPADTPVRDAARDAWKNAMTSWQRNEVLQVGPAGRSTNPDMVAGGQDLRDRIYSWPITLDACGLEAAAVSGAAVNNATPITQTGLGALEHLLFTDTPAAECAEQPTSAQRAAHVQRLANWLVVVADTLRERWEPDAGNFLQQWSTAGAGSTVYATPQAALNAVSIALFYAEKSSKDRKIALPAGLDASGLNCADPVSCPEFLESRLARHSGKNLLANYQAFRDMFTGVDGGLGMNDLLEGIGREDLATEILAELDTLLAEIEAIENDGGFDAAVEAITDADECTNASANSTGLPACALQGVAKTAMDTFRGPIVGALNLAIPQAAAADND